MRTSGSPAIARSDRSYFERTERTGAIRSTSAFQIRPTSHGDTRPKRDSRNKVPTVDPLPSAPGSEKPGASAKPVIDASPHGLPINFPASLQLAGVNPLDIAAATVQVQQGLALLLQAKVLWIPTLTGGVDYSRHDGVQQNIFTGALFQKGRQSLFVGGGPVLSVAVTDAIYEPLAQRTGGRLARGRCTDGPKRCTAGG